MATTHCPPPDLSFSLSFFLPPRRSFLLYSEDLRTRLSRWTYTDENCNISITATSKDGLYDSCLYSVSAYLEKKTMMGTRQQGQQANRRLYRWCGAADQRRVAGYRNTSGLSRMSLKSRL
ncbi:hypothetical protein J6590_000638 [Homalodisca vitripennis]|nr:hypothetical protein J6590_000638 [Homalodisca vitripennis]